MKLWHQNLPLHLIRREINADLQEGEGARTGQSLWDLRGKLGLKSREIDRGSNSNRPPSNRQKALFAKLWKEGEDYAEIAFLVSENLERGEVPRSLTSLIELRRAMGLPERQRYAAPATTTPECPGPRQKLACPESLASLYGNQRYEDVRFARRPAPASTRSLSYEPARHSPRAAAAAHH